jgi:mono/diheme cytochrome c family protein
VIDDGGKRQLIIVLGALMAAWLMALPAGAAGLEAQGNEPRIDYLLHCGGCHGMAGHGSPPVVPSLLGESGLLAGIPGGRDYLIRVPGSAQSRLNDAALARVLTWILESFSADTLPQNFKPFTALEVARGRANILQDPLRRRAEIRVQRQTET